MKCKVTALLVVLAALAVEVSAFADLVTASRATAPFLHPRIEYLRVGFPLSWTSFKPRNQSTWSFWLNGNGRR